MSDMRRIVDGEGSPAELALIEAARADRPLHDDARLKTLAAMTVAAALGAGATKLGGAVAAGASKSGVASKLFSHALLKWAVSVALTAGIGVSAVTYVGSRHAPPLEPPTPPATPAVLAQSREPLASPSDAPHLEPTSGLPTVTPAPSARRLSETPDAPRAAPPPPFSPPPPPRSPDDASLPAQPAPPSPPPPLATRASVPGGGSPGPIDARPPSATAPPPDAALSSEVRLLDDARTALANHNPRAAMSALSDYGRAFPRGALAQEATVMRIDALLQAGERAPAEALANAFLRGDPRGPYAKRVREMLAR